MQGGLLARATDRVGTNAEKAKLKLTHHKSTKATELRDSKSDVSPRMSGIVSPNGDIMWPQGRLLVW